MPYAPIDDRFDDHPKYIEYSAAEMGLISCAITYANRNLTDGRIPKSWPVRRFGEEILKVVKKLLADGVWKVRKDGDYEIVGFLDHNASKAQILDKRAKTRDRVDRWREGQLKKKPADPRASNGVTPHVTEPVTGVVTRRVSNGTTSQTQSQTQTKSQTRSRTQSQTGDHRPRKRGPRLAKAGAARPSLPGESITTEWQPSQTSIAHCKTKGVDVEAVRLDFINYWGAGSRASMKLLDWNPKFVERVELLLEQGRAPLKRRNVIPYDRIVQGGKEIPHDD